jgi:hypothetical protein
MACAALVASGSIGCATSFEPRSPHIAIVRGQFSRGYVKDGVHYDGGPFGGEVGEAVKGVPEAERHTDAYAALSTAGSITIFGSEGLAIGASVVAATVDKGEARHANRAHHRLRRRPGHRRSPPRHGRAPPLRRREHLQC